MLASQKARITRIENLIKSIGKVREGTSVPDSGMPKPVDELWLHKNDEGRRTGPPTTISNATKLLYDTLVQMDEATVPTMEEV